MKVLKMSCLIIFKIILSIGVMCLILSFSLNGFIKGGVSSLLINNPVSVEMFQNIGVDNDKVQEFVKGEEVQEFINSYIEPLFDGGVDVENVNIGSDILRFINDNQEKIEDVIGQPLPMEKIEAYTESEEVEKINETYKEVVSEINNNVPVEVKKSISAFRYFLSNEFRLFVMVICFVSLVTVAVAQGSFYVWIRTLGNMLVWSGVLVLGGSLIISVIFNMVNTNLELDFTNGFYSSLVAIGSGILCLIIYAVIKKIVRDKNGVNKVSKVS